MFLDFFPLVFPDSVRRLRTCYLFLDDPLTHARMDTLHVSEPFLARTVPRCVVCGSAGVIPFRPVQEARSTNTHCLVRRIKLLMAPSYQSPHVHDLVLGRTFESVRPELNPSSRFQATRINCFPKPPRTRNNYRNMPNVNDMTKWKFATLV